MSNQTNVELVTGLMEFSRYGWLSQAFVIEALRYYAKEVKRAGPDGYDSPMISGAAWCGIADEVLEKINNRNK